MLRVRLFLPVLVIFYFTSSLYARIAPANGALLNFTQVMFEYDEVTGADYYIVTIRSNTGDNPILVKNYSLAFIQKQQLQFGKKYRWKYEAYKNGTPFFSSPDYSFEIKTSFQTSTVWLKTTVEVNDTINYKDGIIFLDYMGMAINRKGEPVWFMPLEKDSLDNLKMRNIKITSAGTITYLDNTDCFEKDIYANPLWTAPNDGNISGGGQEFYHHEFFKMEDGSYITSGYRFVNEPNIYDNKINCRVRYNTIIQYDGAGEVLWWWDESKHIDKKKIYGDSGPAATEVTGTHLNGIAYHKHDDAFIVSFRDNSSILKISHKSGEILYNLGDSLIKYHPDEVPFTSQHGPSLLKDGSIVVYNNNLNRTGKTKGPTYPLVKIFSQPSVNKQSEKLWDYECYSEKYPEGIYGKEGYASQLPYNNNLLVCMGGANYIFEVTPGRKVVWQCALQRFDEISNNWTAVNNYRCSYASSLYPCYFTLQQVKKTEKNGIAEINFRINNEGTDDHVFIIEINGKKNQNDIKISAGKNKDVLLKISGNERIIVYPEADKSFQREIYID